jgi:UV DNA damage endonuclease
MTRVRWGLCCAFTDGTPRFRRATHRYVATLASRERERYLGDVALANAVALAHAIERCRELGVGAFRITSQILPLATHPESGYAYDTLPRGGAIHRAYAAAGRLAAAYGIRLSFHPDQFVVLNSERSDVVESSVRELEHQCAIAELVGADVVTLHAGSAAGGKPAALARLAGTIDRLSTRARARLALENDDRTYTPADLLPLSGATGVPLVYDAHHHRCNPDAFTVDGASERALLTWGAREPYFHISSPRAGWGRGDPRPHADFIDPADVPASWRGLALTVDVEAKAKERAVVAVRDALDAIRASRTAHDSSSEADAA